MLLAGDGRAVSSVQSEWGPGSVRTGVVCALYGDSMKVTWCDSGKESGTSPQYRWHLGCILLKMPAISLRTGWFETGACVLLRGTG